MELGGQEEYGRFRDHIQHPQPRPPHARTAFAVAATARLRLSIGDRFCRGMANPDDSAGGVATRSLIS